MNSWLTQNWQTLAVIVVVTVATGLSFDRPNACSIPAVPSNETTINKETEGEDTMLGFTRTKSGVEHANEANFDQLVLSSDVPVLVDFYADWCCPCKLLGPVLEELAGEVSNAKIVKVNVDHSPELAARYDISSIPSLKAFNAGRVVDQHVGLANKAQLKAMSGG